MEKMNFLSLEPRFVFDGAGFETIIADFLPFEENQKEQDFYTEKETQYDEGIFAILPETKNTRLNNNSTKEISLFSTILDCFLTITNNFYQKVFYDEQIEIIMAKAEHREPINISSSLFALPNEKVIQSFLNVTESLYQYSFYNAEEKKMMTFYSDLTREENYDQTLFTMLDENNSTKEIPLFSTILDCFLTITNNFYQKVFYDKEIEIIMAKAEHREPINISSSLFALPNEKVIQCLLNVGESFYQYSFYNAEEEKMMTTSLNIVNQESSSPK